jgi:hypothetical protein
MTANTNPINDALGIVPSPFTTTVSTIVANAKNDSANEDFTYARANIREVIQNGSDAIARMAQIADQSQNARDFEVLSNLMTTVVNASEKLLKVQKSIRELDKVDEPRDQEAKQVTNNLVVGSTAELQKILANIKNK